MLNPRNSGRDRAATAAESRAWRSGVKRGKKGPVEIREGFQKAGIDVQNKAPRKKPGPPGPGAGDEKAPCKTVNTSRTDVSTGKIARDAKQLVRSPLSKRTRETPIDVTSTEITVSKQCSRASKAARVKTVYCS